MDPQFKQSRGGQNPWLQGVSVQVYAYELGLQLESEGSEFASKVIRIMSIPGRDIGTCHIDPYYHIGPVVRLIDFTVVAGKITIHPLLPDTEG